MRRCTRCGEEYPATAEYFHRDRKTKVGLVSRCKSCQREYSRLYHEQNREKFRERQRCYRKQNPEKDRELQRRYRKQNLIKARERDRQRRQRPGRRLHQSVSRGIGLSLRGGKKGQSWETLVGYTREDLMAHLESQFKRGMTWDNYGKWHVDHIRPVSNFSFTSPDDPDFKACWSLWNLQPLWGKDNLSKGARCEKPPLPLLTKGGRG